MAKPIKIGDVIHKEKNQKKNNKTTGQYDKLKKYSKDGNSSTDKSTVSERQIKREAKYIKNLHIDSTYERLKAANLIENDQYKAWWCHVMHTLGASFVIAQAELSMKNARDPSNPAPLFHFLINKAMNKAKDPYSPRL